MPPGTFRKRCGAEHGGVGEDRRRQLRWLAAALRGMGRTLTFTFLDFPIIADNFGAHEIANKWFTDRGCFRVGDFEVCALVPGDL